MRLDFFGDPSNAVIARVCGLTEAHVRYIFETFHEGWDNRAHRDAVLRFYHQWERRSA